MDKIFVAILIISLVIAAIFGNIIMVMAMFEQDSLNITEYGFLIFIAVVTDFILLCILIKKLSKPTANSLLLAKQGIANRLNIKKQSAEIKKTSQNITDSINRLKELRALGIERVSTIRTHHFCQLLAAVSNEKQLEPCLEVVHRREAIVNEISDIEQSIVQLADKYKAAGNAEKCVKYLEFVELEHTTSHLDEIKKACNEQLILREREGKAIRLWITLVIVILSILACICVAMYVKGIPYRELRTKINTQTLTVEAVEWKNDDSNNSYYKYLHSKNGYRFLADVFSELHKNNDIEKAMWLLCVQPNCINGIDLCASDSFIDWVVDYAKENGIKKEQSDGDITYTVNDYEITISSIFDYSIGHTFIIFNRAVRNTFVEVEIRNPYHEGTVPTIK